MKKILLIILSGVSLVACKQDFTNPGAIGDTDAFSTPRGLAGVAVGLQNVYSNGRLSPVYNGITAAGALTNEFRLMNAGNTDELQLFTGGAVVDNLNGIVGNMWTWNNKIIYDADNVITGANKLGDKTYASGLLAYASIFKAMSIGNLAMFFEQIPAAPGTQTAPAAFQSRADGFRRAVTTLRAAQTALGANPPSAAFFANVPTSVTPAFFNNTINALIARYSLFAGDYAGALTAANLVDLNYGGAILGYDAIVTNPIFTTATATNNVYQILDSTLGLPTALAPDLNDQRIAFYTAINPTIQPRYRIKGFFNAATQAIPVYLPDEIRLIKAECYVKQAAPNLTAAVAEIDAVRTQLPSADPFGVGGGLTAYSGTVSSAALTDEIYRQRCIELCMSGMRLEDNRRLGRPVSERRRTFFPYPSRERDNNPNTPADPAN
ncbi:RagB/SusD family nutrient uptake outer membrane protein [Sediminibacterium sp.]|uniref:RagB/SusD family nutrient uptake outer membrane protein n=1 Tax=Sediminibacterium sp. TaxID=1917865 RepID=UPI002730A1A2|nr:RagB/SusD family nutrient uptake outer membrane protein [Sediminibacterium sp.]MDP2422383.1 RagB/SusD family nutrient uptake outer membrane protein [Sediminibacterium sp.]